MTYPDDDEDVVAILYEIGGRRDTPNTSRTLSRAEFDDITGDHDGPVSEASARAAYRARIASRAHRRAGGGR